MNPQPSSSQSSTRTHAPLPAATGNGRSGAAGGAADPFDGVLLAPPDEVLSTLNADGSRRWLRPILARGRFLSARRVVAYALIAVFTVLPHLKIGGKPVILLDVLHRKFTLLGVTFLPTDTVFLALFMLATFIGIFLFTAVLGRVWCGWACPQTVYLEFVYRPIERLFAGTRGRGGRPAKPPTFLRRAGLLAIYALISIFLANTFLAYFVGAGELAHWMQRSPFEHPGSFAVMAVTAGLMMFNFTYFREQTCLLACPYGRFQSALLDRESMIISYDEARGEPRGKLHRSASGELTSPTHGDCIDCHLCVATCPTGIDIRKGLQMECVACAQCIDACDMVMDKVKRPRGLIRYTSQARLAGEPQRLVRARVVVYCLALLVLGASLTTVLLNRPSADVEILRGLGLPYTELPDHRIANPVRIKLTNRTDEAAAYRVTLEDAPAALLQLDPNPITLQAGETQTVGGLIIRPRAAVTAPSMKAHFRVRDGGTLNEAVPYILLGPATTGGGR